MGNGSGEAEKIDSEVGEIDLLKEEGVNFAAALPKKKRFGNARFRGFSARVIFPKNDAQIPRIILVDWACMFVF